MSLSAADRETLLRIRRDGRRHADGCLDVAALGGHANHLQDAPFTDEQLVDIFAEISWQGRARQP